MIQCFLKDDGKRGFTLIELVIVIAILAILAAIALPTFGNMIEETKKDTCDRNRDTASRTLLMDLILEPMGTVAQKNELADTELERLGAEKSGSTYSGLCPSGGTYTVGFSNDRVFVACSCVTHGGEQWATGMTFAVGDTMTTNGYVFECLRNHTSGTTSRTRNPSLRSNKSTWQVVAFSGDPLPYSSTVRYAVGFQVVYTDNKSGFSGIYARKDFNMPGGQVPYNKMTSNYWTYIGPVE